MVVSSDRVLLPDAALIGACEKGQGPRLAAKELQLHERPKTESQDLYAKTGKLATFEAMRSKALISACGHLQRIDQRV